MQIKRTKRRTAMLAAMAMTSGAFFAVMAPGIAQAQSGSRICGNWWAGVYNHGQNEVIWARVIEVPKTDNIACQRAIDRTDKVGPTTLPQRIKNFKDLKWGGRQRISGASCEWFSQDLMNAKYGDDVCLSMQRADNTVQVDHRTISHFWVDN
ncbi:MULTISPECIES: hypothetical protein [unclassified Streptomyces]|uniref:hypothetical protein n=1 Tax=unclassified Streptomyces TaxID=2593676 RepID=UPI000DD9B939|nr:MULTISPECIES: hypothetical protein [unclassified Streptomyces]QZZ25666.1 hypothetical protein A7X85_04775 [Streptomyces sp. ST1015]